MDDETRQEAGQGIRIDSRVYIPESELEYETCRASGPGGQYVNTTDSAVQLRFNVLNSPSLPEVIRIRLLGIAGKLVNEDGVLVIKAQTFRHQLRNRFAVRERLIALLMKAATPPTPRKRTAVPRISREVRMELKHRVSLTKRHRRKVRPEEED